MAIPTRHGAGDVKCVGHFCRFILCLLLLGGLTCSCSKKTEEPIAFSAKERLILEQFFQVLVKTDSLGSVLFGSKPMSLCCYFHSVPFGNLICGCNSFAIKRGWHVWQKYEKHIDHPEYIIFAEDVNVEGLEICHIYFMNKRNVLDTLNKHRSLFEQELGLDFDPNIFLANLEKSHSLMGLINHNEALFGILLGYGAESSINYHRRNLVWELGLPITYNDDDFQAVTFDYASSCVTAIRPIAFAGNPDSSEVKAIVEQNTQERAQISDIYSDGKFLEISLKKIKSKI